MTQLTPGQIIQRSAKKYPKKIDEDKMITFRQAVAAVEMAVNQERERLKESKLTLYKNDHIS